MNDQKLLTFTPNTKKEKTKMSKPVSFMIDSAGHEVPTKYVSAYDKLRDRNVKKIVGCARNIRNNLESFVQNSIALLDQVAGLKETLGEKGNLSVSSFDGLMRVSIRQRYNIFLDERVIKAREKMLGYINGVLTRVKPEDAAAMRIIVEEAFRVGANQMLSTAKVVQLLRMNIKNADWIDAQQILKDSLKPQKGKRYLTIETRPNMNHDFRSIRLDIADCWPVDSAASVPEVV